MKKSGQKEFENLDAKALWAILPLLLYAGQKTRAAGTVMNGFCTHNHSPAVVLVVTAREALKPL